MGHAKVLNSLVIANRFTHPIDAPFFTYHPVLHLHITGLSTMIASVKIRENTAFTSRVPVGSTCLWNDHVLEIFELQLTTLTTNILGQPRMFFATHSRFKKGVRGNFECVLQSWKGRGPFSWVAPSARSSWTEQLVQFLGVQIMRSEYRIHSNCHFVLVGT